MAKPGQAYSGFRRTQLESPSAKRASGREYLVEDRSAFAKALNEAIERLFAGNRNAASKACGVPYNTLKRYCEGKGGALRQETFSRLLDLVSWVDLDSASWKDGTEELLSALISPRVRDRRVVYRDWLGQEVRNLLSWYHRSFSAGSLSKFRRARLMLRELRRIRGDIEARFPRQFDAFKQYLTKQGHPEDRRELALDRVVAPFLDSRRSDYIERHWTEFSDDELRQFIEAGISRERLLLAREPDMRRAQDVERLLADDPNHFRDRASWIIRHPKGITLAAWLGDKREAH
jgi:hypothetical protein